MKRIQLPKSLYNTLSIIGAGITLVAGVTLAFFLVLIATVGEANPYIGVFVYLVLPPVLAFGVILIPIGVIRKRRRIRRHLEDAAVRWPAFDLNRSTHRNAFFLFVFGMGLLTMISVVGGYQAYHYTESVEFCGTTCHAVMEPEYTAYANSPHARVSCASCHVGAGAGWYAKSKLSGAYQVYAAAFNKYPRPIPTPVRNLRPAQETCEQCHWPEKFFGAQQRQFNHYMYDEANTHVPINMLVKVGGGDPKTGQTAGIHWHMNIGVAVKYIARDERRQDIPWIQITDRLTGRVTTYQDEDNPLSEEELATADKRTMDCMDCHNRPSHKYNSPDHAVDQAILTGAIDQTLPEVKRAAVEAMQTVYETKEAAFEAIAAKIPDFYRENYPDVFKTRMTDIDEAVLATQYAFSQNIFPYMKVRWEDYPDNIGHFIFPGCMRCHDGKKVSAEGWKITRDCTACHSILRQGAGENMQVAVTEEGLEFSHPDGSDDWRDTNCNECHSGTQP
ncbi:MAG TPA: NapC/NirT family cytochrome c [Candidatus Krumholzibacteria bacterium]|nr:NapC/NirT family cytochrome c [Candidatus Krumholzibacteria bacterium]